MICLLRVQNWHFLFPYHPEIGCEVPVRSRDKTMFDSVEIEGALYPLTCDYGPLVSAICDRNPISDEGGRSVAAAAAATSHLPFPCKVTD